jgi:hypothetical protein
MISAAQTRRRPIAVYILLLSFIDGHRFVLPQIEPVATLQPSDNLVVNAMHGGGKVLVNELRCTVADDDIAIGSVADRWLVSGVVQTSHFKGFRTVFGTKRACRGRLTISAPEGKTDVPREPGHFRF